MEIRAAQSHDFDAIVTVINDAANAYRGVIPADCWHEPYMPPAALAADITDGVVFTLAVEGTRVSAVMGLQDRGEVTLIRHAYVASACQRRGLGGKLLQVLAGDIERPVLIGTWAAAAWAIAFYRRLGYTAVSTAHKNDLLKRYWSVAARQIEASVVLANASARASFELGERPPRQK